MVFLAACKSQFLGEIFCKAEAKHTIFIEDGKKIDDEVALYFTRNFYTLLFQGEQICSAFKVAKEMVGTKFSYG